MKKMIYNVFDGLVMAMMFAALLNLAVVKTSFGYMAMLGLFAIGGVLLEVSGDEEEVRGMHH